MFLNTRAAVAQWLRLYTKHNEAALGQNTKQLNKHYII